MVKKLNGKMCVCLEVKEGRMKSGQKSSSLQGIQ